MERERNKKGNLKRRNVKSGRTETNYRDSKKEAAKVNRWKNNFSSDFQLKFNINILSE